MDSRVKLPAMVLAWCLVVPSLLGSSNINDPILTHMCSTTNGAKFWRNFLECGIVLKSEVLTVLNACIPVSSEEEAERTRCSVCSKPGIWKKVMDCMNVRLIEYQDESNPHLELSPGILYRTCVNVLIQEAESALEKNESFLPEDHRSVTSNCSLT